MSVGDGDVLGQSGGASGDNCGGSEEMDCGGGGEEDGSEKMGCGGVRYDEVRKCCP